jgi:uncharacterized protein YprB with RNaseH-like and TPR domain
MALYLDIETDYDNQITVIGFYSYLTGLVQLVGSDITPPKVEKALPKVNRLYTFNGTCFDLPVIERQLSLRLKEWYECHDLMHLCRRAGLHGGQKRIEERLGIGRQLPGMKGRDAQWLWYQYEVASDLGALEDLLLYNREDVMNMVKIRRYLKKIGASD